LYEQHIVTCEYLYQSKKTKDRDLDVIEHLPSAQEQFKLIQHLALQLTRLQKEVELLRGNMNIRKKKMVIEWLHSTANPTPLVTFAEWSKLIQVNDAHLSTVFTLGLTAGIKKAIEAYFEYSSIPPIRAFKQKPGTFYIYDMTEGIDGEDNSVMRWRALTNDESDRWVDLIMHKFLQKFIQWQLVNMDLANSCESDKDRFLDYMQKINGSGQSDERRKSDLRKWLFVKLEQNIREIE
jgi:hypothetical protein